jgi:hypothetical protein
MPTNLQSLLVLLVFVLPGFVAVEIDARSRPARERSTFDKTALSVFYSTLVHLALVPLATFLATWLWSFDPAVVDSNWATEQMQQHLWRSESLLLGYFATAMLSGALFGYTLSKFKGQTPPVWAQETYVRVQRRGFAQAIRERLHRPRYTAALSVLVLMKNGDQYAGLLKTLPGEFDELQRKDKFFSIQKVAYRPKDATPQTLQPGQVVLLNTDNVDAMWIGEEPLP